MRVITGTARGMKLKEPSNYDIRPTTDKVKESIFNILQFKLQDKRVLDLFAGTGQLGIEALSRGAESAVFTDMSREAIKLINENLAHTGFADAAEVYRTDALSYLKRGEKFDIILIDPPYATDLLEKAMDIIASFDILNENGIIICESGKEKTLRDVEGLQKKEYRYGKILLTTFTKTAAEK